MTSHKIKPKDIINIRGLMCLCIAHVDDFYVFKVLKDRKVFWLGDYDIKVLLAKKQIKFYRKNEMSKIILREVSF